MDALLTRLRRLLPGTEAADDLLLELLTQAQALILGYTGRHTMPQALTDAWLRLAVVLYNRLGTEGERARREGSLAIQFAGLPEELQMLLRAWRVAKVAP